MKKQFTPKEKARIAIEALRGTHTNNQLSSRYEAHPVQIGMWKKQLRDNAHTAFSTKHNKEQKEQQAMIDRLYNLADPHFDRLEGVYVIFRGGPNPQVLRVGQGLIRERLRVHKVDPALLAYGRLRLHMTWAKVHAWHRDGVERFLADTYRPPTRRTVPERAADPRQSSGRIGFP